MRKSALFIAAGAFSLLCTAALAQPPGGHGFGPPPMMDSGAGRVLALLLRPDTLTDAQQQQVQTVLDADHAAVHDILDKLRAANDQMSAALLADSAPTSESLSAVTDQISELRKSLMAQQVDTALAVRAVLTPEQLAAAEARQEEMAAHEQEHEFRHH